jgi:hypothetical protein
MLGNVIHSSNGHKLPWEVRRWLLLLLLQGRCASLLLLLLLLQLQGRCASLLLLLLAEVVCLLCTLQQSHHAQLRSC